jgi:hypothetical protein
VGAWGGARGGGHGRNIGGGGGTMVDDTSHGQGRSRHGVCGDHRQGHGLRVR